MLNFVIFSRCAAIYCSRFTENPFMKKWPAFLAFAFAAAQPVTLVAADITWPQGQRAAVSLSYDDSLNSQLDYAVPTLNQHGIKGSFYMQLTSPVVSERMDEWRAVAKAGHELGNHSIFHACSASKPGRSWVPAHNDLNKRTVAQMQQEIATANTFLQALDGRELRTLTPPCLDAEAADGNYVEAVRDQFVAIKGAENNLPAGAVTLLMPNGHTGKQLIEFVKDAAKRGGMANIIFHGIDGDHLSVSSKAHAELIEFLAKNKNVYWTDTYLNIMQHVNEMGASAKK